MIFDPLYYVAKIFLESLLLACWKKTNVNTIMRIKKLKDYWKRNILYLGILLTAWFIFAFLLPISFADELNRFRLGGFKLGFWFAQQGSIYAFVLIIFVYVWLMNRLDRKFDVDEK